jgi:hypothetical protein
MKKTYVFREAWPYHFDPLFDWISALGDEMALRTGILRSSHLRIGFLDAASSRVFPGDPHHSFH